MTIKVGDEVAVWLGYPGPDLHVGIVTDVELDSVTLWDACCGFPLILGPNGIAILHAPTEVELDSKVANQQKDGSFRVTSMRESLAAARKHLTDS